MKIVKPVDNQFWWDVARKCDYATFFHTPLWNRLVLLTYPAFRDSTIAAELKNGTRVILPLLKRETKGISSNLISTFGQCYGGIIADGCFSKRDIQQIYHKASWMFRYIHITSNPIDAPQSFLKGFSSHNDFTHILSLDSDIDNILSNFSNGHKYNARRGQKLGVEVRIADSIDDYRAYFAAYEDSLRRWGNNASSRYPWHFFENGFYLAQEYSNSIKLWLAVVEEKVVAGAWVFYWNQHVDWWHGAAYEDYFDYYPNNVLQTAIIRNAKEQGYKFYDFNPSGGHEGVSRFKSRFGAEQRTIERVIYIGPMLKAYRKIRRIFAL